MISRCQPYIFFFTGIRFETDDPYTVNIICQLSLKSNIKQEIGYLTDHIHESGEWIGVVHKSVSMCAKSCPTALWDPVDCNLLYKLLCWWDYRAKIYWVSWHFLLRDLFNQRFESLRRRIGLLPLNREPPCAMSLCNETGECVSWIHLIYIFNQQRFAEMHYLITVRNDDETRTTSLYMKAHDRRIKERTEI